MKIKNSQENLDRTHAGTTHIPNRAIRNARHKARAVVMAAPIHNRLLKAFEDVKEFYFTLCAFGRVLTKREQIQVRSESAVRRAFLALLLDADTSHAVVPFRTLFGEGSWIRESGDG